MVDIILEIGRFERHPGQEGGLFGRGGDGVSAEGGEDGGQGLGCGGAFGGEGGGRASCGCGGDGEELREGVAGAGVEGLRRGREWSGGCEGCEDEGRDEGEHGQHVFAFLGLIGCLWPF